MVAGFYCSKLLLAKIVPGFELLLQWGIPHLNTYIKVLHLKSLQKK